MLKWDVGDLQTKAKGVSFPGSFGKAWGTEGSVPSLRADVATTRLSLHTLPLGFALWATLASLFL